MSHKSRNLIEDIIEACDIVLEYRTGLSFDEFERHRMPFDAILRRLIVIGEAASQIPLAERQQYTDVEWKKIVGLRNLVVHRYSGIDDDIVWDVIQNHVPVLREELVQVLSSMTDDEAT